MKWISRHFLVCMTLILVLILPYTAYARGVKSGEDGIVSLDARNTGMLSDTLSLSADSLWAGIESEKEKQRLEAENQHIAKALEVVVEIRDALMFLQAGEKDSVLTPDEKDSVLAVLEKVDGKIDLLLARYPETALIPLDFSVDVVNLAPDLEEVKEARERVEDMVDDGHLQEARKILDGLVSEIRITTVNLPLVVFPLSIDEAARLLEEGKEEDAEMVLQEMLSSLEVLEENVPIPVVNAISMVDEAANLAESNKAKARDLLHDARHQLKLAEVLGYGNRDVEYSDIVIDIETITDKLEEEGDTDGLWDSLITRIRRFKNRISSSL